MQATIPDAGAPESCHPLTIGRELGDCPVAGNPLRAWQREELTAAGYDMTAQDPGDDAIRLRGDAWVDAAELRRLSHRMRVLRVDGEPVAWIGREPLGEGEACEGLLIRYPWDLLAVHTRIMARFIDSDVSGSVADGVHVDGVLMVGEGSRILPGVYIEGTVVIGRDCKIGPNCYLRGPTAIGDGCHIGQAVEIKASIVMDNVGIGHLSYAGDSIIGNNTNFGAGTITANFRHDGKNHRSVVDGELIDTGRRKFGAIIGDDVHTGIHTSIYPGRKLWPHTATRPGDIVQKDLKG